MPLVIRLRSETDSTDWVDYNYGIKGRIHKALEGTEWKQSHDDNSPPQFSFSELYPFSHDIHQGDIKYLLVDAVDDGLLRELAERFQRRPTIYAGNIEFDIRAVGAVRPPLGDRGTLVSTSGMLMYVGEDDTGQKTFWTSEIDGEEGSFEAFRDQFRRLARGLCRNSFVPEPTPESPIVDRFEFLRDFAFPMTVTDGQRMTVIASKWRFAFETRDETHAEQLRLLARHGLGAETGYGLGALTVAPSPTASPMQTVDWYARKAFDDSFLQDEEAIVA